MSGNGYSAYFGQMIATGAGEPEDGNNTTQKNPTGTTDNSSQTIVTGTDGIQGPTPDVPGLEGQNTVCPRAQSPVPDDVFRASLISWMDALVQDFRTEKASKSETLYQILKTLLEAGIEESDHRSTLKEYTLYIDIIAYQQKGAEY